MPSRVGTTTRKVRENLDARVAELMLNDMKHGGRSHHWIDSKTVKPKS